MSPSLHELEDVEVLTVGFVPRGANQEEFFLLKSQEGGGEMAPNDVDEVLEEELIEEAESMPETGEEIVEPEAEERGILQAIARLVRKAEHSPVQDAAKELLAAIRGKRIPPELQWVVRALEAAAAGKPYGKPYGYGYPAPMRMQKAAEPEPKPEPEKSGLEEKLAILEKANEDLRARLEKAEQEAAAERKARRLQELEQMAGGWTALPAQPGEVAKLLAWLEDQEGGKEQAETLTRILKAADQALAKSDLFRELGSTEAPDELAEIARAADPVAAALQMDPRQQWEYIRKQRR